MSAGPALALEKPAAPYPGLRPFEMHEWSIFFGRERMIDDIIERLARNRLVLIHGASGSGKSSLVRAGILPKLARQHQRHGAPWLTCAMRPSGGPLWNLATELARLEGRADDTERAGAITGLCNRRDASLATVAGTIEELAGKSLCILVDQFEELFRFEKETSREEAELFVDLIARTTAAEEAGAADVHVIVTMRSEFLGECARFDGLAEIINRTQYLVPRMDDEALLRAVRRPAQLFNGFVSEALADHLVTRVRGREDELPLLQHGLMLIWDAARASSAGGRVVPDGALVEEAGGLAELLSAHADRVMATVAPDASREKLVESVFRELTDVNAEGSAIRRPRTLAALAAVAYVTPDALRPIIDAFRAPGVSFLAPYAPAPVHDQTIIDISHEALIRCWNRIASGQDCWLKQEFDDGLAWRSLTAEAEGFAKDKARVLSAAATKDRGLLYTARNEAWSRRYGGGWMLVGGLLEASRRAAGRRRRATWAAMGSMAALSIGALTLAYVGFVEREQAETQNELGRLLLDRLTEHDRSCPRVAADQILINKAQTAADRGNNGAYYMLGMIYECGLGVSRDRTKARENYEKAANAGDKDAMRDVGVLYSDYSGPDHDYIKAREWYEKAAAAGDAISMRAIGMLYDNGQGVAQDYAEARDWYEKGAAAGDAIAMRFIGDFHESGHGVPPDYVKAREWYEKAATAGDAPALRSIGLLYDNGQGVPQSYAKAREFYEKAAAKRDSIAFRNIGYLFESGRGVAQDYAKAREWYEKGAAAGDAIAMRYIGDFYESGHGVPQDYAKAREWYEKSAIAGDATAMRGIGSLYDHGQGVSQSYAKAREFYEKAVAKGDFVAFRNIGYLYESGHGVTQDYAKAREWYEKGAAAGDAIAMRYIGDFYESGHGVPQDYAKAREWYEKAVVAGDAVALRNIGLLYDNGQGVPQNYTKAREYYEKAAAKGDLIAFLSIGYLYESDHGLGQDYAKAREWYEKGAAAGDATAMRRLGLLYRDGKGVRQDYAKSLEWLEKALAAGDSVSVLSISWVALFARDFPRALAAAEQAHKIDTRDLATETNHAHALMFLGRDREAMALYLSHWNEPVPDVDNKTWQQVILDDFAELRKAGLGSALMKTVEAAFAARSEAAKAK